jgi:hypothetical protein
MKFLLALAAFALILLVLVDGFETVLLPRRIMRPYRFARQFYRTSWKLWLFAARLIRPGKRRESFLSMFGPLSLLGLLTFWCMGLIIGFGLLQWSLEIPFRSAEGELDPVKYIYMSGTMFFTLGLGDITPLSWVGRLLSVFEAGLGFAFLACIIGYLPVLYQTFSRRERTISLLDARAGSPPSAAAILLRAAKAPQVLNAFMAEWETWAADLLESHLSYPVLSFYRSQHDNQSWIAALTAILDTCALRIAGLGNSDSFQAQITFAMARHVVVDLALVFNLPPLPPPVDRLSGAEFAKLRDLLLAGGVPVPGGPQAERKLAELREMYEPFVNALARHFMLSLPVIVAEHTADNWQRSAWTRRTPGIGKLGQDGNEHF